MATLKQPITPQRIKRMSVADVRDEYINLAEEYNKLTSHKYLLCQYCGEFQSADSAFYTDSRTATGKFCMCKR